MNGLQLQDNEPESLSGLVTRLVESPWRWEILLKQAALPSGSEHYQMVLEAIRDCVSAEDPNADHSIWPGVRKLENSSHLTDREAARLLANAGKAERAPVEVNK